MRIALLLLTLCFISSAFAQSTRPSVPTRLEIRANAAFERADYAVAMTLYVKLSQQVKDDPKRLGALQERIRVCQKNLAGRAPDPAAVLNPSSDIKTSPEERKVHKKPADGEALELPIKLLGNFDYDIEKGGNIPDDVKKLNGSKIKTFGFMIPIDQADKITQFALVPSLFACCFGQPPQVQHTLLVKTPKGKAVAYYPDELAVEGTLKVEETKEDGIVVNVFEIECTSVKPAAK
jgi:hypothetical protein